MNEQPTMTLMEQVRPALVILVLLTLLTGVIYPLVITGVGQALFPNKADGSLITRGGKVVGSALIGQPFDDPRYFWGRLSGTTPAYNAAASSGTNYGPLNPLLTEMVQGRIDALRAVDPDNTAPIPVDLVTASGSGLDPHISPAAAYYQVARVARERELDEAVVRDLVDEHTSGRLLGVLGEPRVNVLELNLALDALE